MLTKKALDALQKIAEGDDWGVSPQMIRRLKREGLITWEHSRINSSMTIYVLTSDGWAALSQGDA